ncbi:sigma-70 family RNA polymerase sigma factor [uncultured Sphingomonas sp.]|uniref:RNA polymerase sigma factor n=1 Tax=uncultured Sphingomonas sp. TaxID=158754 RepID=UPI00341ED2AF
MHVLNTRLSPASPRRLRGGGSDAIPREGQCKAPRDVRAALGPVRLPLEEGDPLPPDHDRVAPVTVADTLYRAERPGLLRFLHRRAAEDRAEDIVQQVFVRLVARERKEAVTLDAPGAYLREAANNLLLDHARAAGRASQAQHVSIDDVDISGGDPMAALEARDRLARIEQAVLRLKPLTRQIFLACRLDGYSYAEIAEQTGLSVRGVEKQMSRAIKQLGRHLRRHD